MVFLKRETSDIDLINLVDDQILTRFLETTQTEELDELKIDLSDTWLSSIKEEIRKKLVSKKGFELIQEGIDIKGRRFKLVYYKPETTHNPEELKRYESNIFSYVRQFTFSGTMESIDIVLFLNGLPIITIELKNLQTGQNVDDAVSQYISRDKKELIFSMPFLHLAADTIKAKIATQFVENSTEDFVHFNKDIENTNPLIPDDYPVDYLYHDIFRPESLIDIIEDYLFCHEEKDKTGRNYRKFLFPRYHQRRTVINLMSDLNQHFKEKKELDKKYLIQHSPGSGKSYTIAVLQKFLRNAHVDNLHLFDSVIVVTDRLNLDNQIQGTITSSETQFGIIEHAESTAELASSLNRNTKVIITTIQKFSVKKLNDLLESQKGKRICLIIDEAHRSQTGKYRSNLMDKFDEEQDYQQEIIQGIGIRTYPNVAFIALTATPSNKTLEIFGKPFDTYSMDQAETEGYILNVVENVITYSTLYKLSHEIQNKEEYPPLVVSKKLKAKAFEDEAIIKEKVDIILKIFESNTKPKINGQAKVMIVTSSRLSAVKYKLILDKALKSRNLDYKSLVAFSGTVKHDGISYTEVNMNKIEEKIETEFDKLGYRFIVVANKFQYGFNQPYLHTMFLDKSVSGINAVQTISRLNRTLVGKNDTLVVDFTDSYKEIIAAFRKFKGAVDDFSGIDVHDLPNLQNELLSFALFTMLDVDDFKNAVLQESNPAATTIVLNQVAKNIVRLPILEFRSFKSLLNRFNNTFKYMDNLFRITSIELRDFALFTNYLAKFIDPFGKGGKLDEELKKVYIVSHVIRPEKKEPEPLRPLILHRMGRRAPIYTTIPEVIDAVNVHYEMALSGNEINLFEQYVQVVVNNQQIIAEIKANKSSDLEKLYTNKLSAVLKEMAINFFLTYNPSRLFRYIEKDIISHLNEEAFRYAVFISNSRN